MCTLLTEVPSTTRSDSNVRARHNSHFSSLRPYKAEARRRAAARAMSAELLSLLSRPPSPAEERAAFDAFLLRHAQRYDFSSSENYVQKIYWLLLLP